MYLLTNSTHMVHMYRQIQCDIAIFLNLWGHHMYRQIQCEDETSYNMHHKTDFCIFMEILSFSISMNKWPTYPKSALEFLIKSYLVFLQNDYKTSNRILGYLKALYLTFLWRDIQYVLKVFMELSRKHHASEIVEASKVKSTASVALSLSRHSRPKESDANTHTKSNIPPDPMRGRESLFLFPSFFHGIVISMFLCSCFLRAPAAAIGSDEFRIFSVLRCLWLEQFHEKLVTPCSLWAPATTINSDEVQLIPVLRSTAVGSHLKACCKRDSADSHNRLLPSSPGSSQQDCG